LRKEFGMEISVRVTGSFRETRKLRLKIEELIKEIGVDLRKASVHVHRHPVLYVGGECHPKTIVVEMGLSPHWYVQLYDNGPTEIKTMIDKMRELDIVPNWRKRAIILAFLER
jgi:hypothetical protein